MMTHLQDTQHGAPVSPVTGASPSAAVGRPLPHIPPGMCAKVTAIDAADDDLERLKAMGVCVGRSVELVQAGDPLILKVWGSRIGVSARLAQLVLVDGCHDPCCQPPGTGGGSTPAPAAG